MKQRVILIVVALVSVGLGWWLLAGRTTERGIDDVRPPEAGDIDRRAIVDEKLRARSAGEIDLSPAAVRGEVTEAESGAPVPDAVVLLTPKGLDPLARALSPGEQSGPLRARTDAQGRFSLAPVPAGRYALTASGVGYLSATRTDLTLRAGQDHPGLDLVLRRGGHELRGTVSDIVGGPVEDVLVRVTRTDEGSPFNFDRPALASTTDEDGRFSMQLPDGVYQLQTFHPDYVDATQGVRIDGGPRSVPLQVTPAATIEGRVFVRDSGEPLAGAVVTHSGETGGFVVSGLGEGQVTTDEQGRFRLRGLGSGVVKLSALGRGYATRQPVEVVLGVAEQVSDVRLTVDRALTVSGFVVPRGDETSGLQGVLVGAFSFEPPRLFVATAPSAADGYFEIFGVQPGSYTVGAVGEEALPSFLGATAVVGEHDVTDVLVVMDAGVHVRGRVSPVRPATLSIRVDMEGVSIGTMTQTLGNAVVRARTEADGSFDLHPVAEGMLTVVAEADDGSRGERQVQVGTADLQDLVIELRPRASVRGRVTDAAGRPGSGLEVVLYPRVSSATTSTAGVGGALAGAAVPGTATTDEDGNFVVKGLDAGDYDMSVVVGPGQPLEWAQPQRPEQPKAPILLTVADGERREGLSLVVEARDQVITGVVLGPQGEPVADAWVTAVRSGSVRERMGQMGPAGADAAATAQPLDEDRERQVRQLELLGLSEPPVLTDAAGRFTVQGLRSGRYRLRAEAHKDGARGFVDEVEPGADVRIPLESLAGLEGLVSASGTPVREYTLEVRGREVRTQQVYAPDGRFTLGRLDPGDVEVVAHCSEGTAKTEVTIEPGQTTSVNLEIGGWGTLSGIVVDAGTGDPIAGISVGALGDTGPSAGSVKGMVTGIGPKTDDQGRFEIDQVPPGEGTLVFFDREATGPDGLVARAEYVIEPEEHYDLGTITGVAPSYVSPNERGTVGLVVQVATYANRPRAPLAEDDEQEAAFDQTPRLWVLRVTPYGPAARQGLVPGDEVLSVDGSGVRGMGADNAAKLLSARYLRVGDELVLEIEHDDDRRGLTLTVEPTDG